MAIERKWIKVPPQAITSNGTVDGHLGVPNSTLFKVKQKVLVYSSVVTTKFALQVKRINSLTDIELGPIGGKHDDRTDLTTIKVSEMGMILSDFQDRTTISWEDIRRAVYEEEPTVALRTIWVDKLGQAFDSDNPIPIVFDGTISVGKVQVEGENGNTIEPNTDGSINVKITSGGGNGNTVNTYNEVSSVSSGVLTPVSSYTVPGGKTATVERIYISSDTVSEFSIFVNTVQVDIKRLYWSQFDGTLDYVSSGIGFKLLSGDVITVKAIHNRPDVATFDSRIQVVEF